MSGSTHALIKCTDDKSAWQKEDKMKRRMRRKRHNAHRRDTGMTGKALSVMVIICFSVLAGYITANYMIGPMLGLESEPVFSDFLNEKKEDTESEPEDKKGTKVVQDTLPVQNQSGFALQYGSFSVREGAKQYADELAADGIDTSIIEKDGSYKVIGKVFKTKEEARAYKESEDAGKDIFITEIP